jgi:hypothetical protein
MFEHIETMQEMKKRVGRSDAAGQINAVIAAIAAINKASGYLDEDNRATALFHLSVALAGPHAAKRSLEYAVNITDPRN